MGNSIRVEGVDELIKKLKTLYKNAEAKSLQLIDEMLADGEVYAIKHLGHFDTGATALSIKGYRDGNKGVIVAGKNAIWIEFGTGVTKNVGNTHPPVVQSSITLYGHGGYGQGKGASPSGWWYFSATKPKNNPYYKEIEYPDGRKGYIVHTMGIQGNMFMYRAYEELVRQFPERATEVFKNLL